MAGAGNVLGDDDDPTIPVAERARAEDAKLRKMFSIMENEGVVNEFSCGASATYCNCSSRCPPPHPAVAYPKQHACIDRCSTSRLLVDRMPQHSVLNPAVCVSEPVALPMPRLLAQACARSTC